MKKIVISVMAMLFGFAAFAQEIVVPAGYELVDSLVYRIVSQVDSTLAGKDVFESMPSMSKGGNADVLIRQDANLARAMRSFVEDNGQRTITGYRVRVFFDNKQTARAESEETLKRFRALFPGIEAYRTYANPYFKVTVGNFRTKSEAMAKLEDIKSFFPSAFVIKENIDFPLVDSRNSYVVDTVKVLRPVAVNL